jgi:lipopolysaccharide export system permease protein
MLSLVSFWHFRFRAQALALGLNLKTLHKYLTVQVLASLLLTVAVFTFVLLLGNVLKEVLKVLVSGQARPTLVLEAVGLLVPFAAVYALPMGFITATLLVFGRFSADQELTAARASGVSLLSLITPVLLLSLFCCGVSAWFNMDLGPRSRMDYKNLLLRARADLASAQLPAGRVIHDFPDYVFYIEKSHSGDLEGVTVFWLSGNTSIYAPRGRADIDKPNHKLSVHLFDARSVTTTTNGTTRLGAAATWGPIILDLNTETNRTVKPGISDMTFAQLREELREREQLLSLLPPKLASSSGATDGASTNSAAAWRAQITEMGKMVERVRVEMHRQIAFSFACFGFALIGIPLGIRMHRRETNIGIAIALGLVVVYYSFILLGEALAARPEFAPHLIFWLPNFIFQAVGAVLLWRVNKGT